jgi:hypothetical protein
MPSPATLEAFVATVEAGDFVGAIERWYAPDAWMRENLGPLRQGRERLMQEEAAMMGQFTNISAARQGPPMVSGDQVAIRWRFEFFTPQGLGRVLEEVAWQVWKDDRIVEETFFYDPAQMAG